MDSCSKSYHTPSPKSANKKKIQPSKQMKQKNNNKKPHEGPQPTLEHINSAGKATPAFNLPAPSHPPHPDCSLHQHEHFLHCSQQVRKLAQARTHPARKKLISIQTRSLVCPNTQASQKRRVSSSTAYSFQCSAIYCLSPEHTPCFKTLNLHSCS